MSAVSLEQVLRLAEQLNETEREILVRRLQSTLLPLSSERVTREMLLAELEELRAKGAFENVESLRNKYADPPLDLTDEELLASLHEIATEWEAELDDYSPED